MFPIVRKGNKNKYPKKDAKISAIPKDASTIPEPNIFIAASDLVKNSFPYVKMNPSKMA